MRGTIRKTRRKRKKKDPGFFLDKIIDKYSATPENDPELVDYSLRPTREETQKEQIEHVSWSSASA